LVRSRGGPSDAFAYNWRGKAHFDNKQYDPAITDLEPAFRLDPLLSEARQNRERARAALAIPPIGAGSVPPGRAR